MLVVIPVVIGIIAAVLYRITPSVLAPVIWKDPSPVLKLEGNLAPNSILKHAVKVAANLHGPESTAFDDEDGTAYVSFGDGTVRSFGQEGVLQDTVFFTGGIIDGSVPGNGVGQASAALQEWCTKESNSGRLAWDFEGERKCGRPLGLRFRKVVTNATRRLVWTLVIVSCVYRMETRSYCTSSMHITAYIS
jgi:hypothetical protein